jgi:hypothetical protein
LPLSGHSAREQEEEPIGECELQSRIVPF